MTEQPTLNRKPICMKGCRNFDEALTFCIQAENFVVADVGPTLGVDPLLDCVREIPTHRPGLDTNHSESPCHGDGAYSMLDSNLFQTVPSGVLLGQRLIVDVWSVSLWMMFAVLRSISDFKILKSVVELVVIFVVNHFRRFERSPQMFLHYMPVLKYSPSVNSQQKIAAMSKRTFAASFAAQWSEWISVPTQSEVMSVA